MGTADYTDNNYASQAHAQPDRAQVNTSVNHGGHSGASSSSMMLKQPSNEIKQNAFETSSIK